MRAILSILTIFLIALSSCGTNNVKEPEYRDIRNIRLIYLGPLQSTAGVDLVYYNPNKFGVQLESARGDIYIDSSYFGQFELNEKVQVKNFTAEIKKTKARYVKIKAINSGKLPAWHESAGNPSHIFIDEIIVR